MPSLGRCPCDFRPLHRAIELNFSDQVILALLAANEDATKTSVKSDSSPYLPLHLGTKNDCSKKVILALLATNTKAAITEPRYKIFPLLMAIELNHHDDIISALLAANPEAACESDYKSMTLMSHAIQKRYSDARLAELLVAIFNSNHYYKEKAKKEALGILIEESREQVLLKAVEMLSDHGRRNMLCFIIETISSESAIFSLVSKFPTIGSVDEPVNKAIKFNRSDGVIIALLESHAHNEKRQIYYQRCPLHNAMKLKRTSSHFGVP